MQQLPDDFKDLLLLFNEKKVEYLIVGGWALGVHGYIRATGDMDIWISQSDENIESLLSALSDFGVPSGVGREFFKEPGNAFRIGNPPIQIEIITEASGIRFQSSYAKRVLIEADDITIPFLSYNDLITNKRASGRLRDLADLEGLGEDP